MVKDLAIILLPLAFRVHSGSNGHIKHSSMSAMPSIGHPLAGASSTPLPASSILLVGDANYLLFYRLSRSDMPNAPPVSITFLYDLKVRVLKAGPGNR